MYRHPSALLSASALCAFLAQPAYARPRPAATQAPTIEVVAGHETIPQWQARVSAALDRHLAYPGVMQTERDPEGLVRVAFRCDADGRPSDIRIISSSRNTRLDQAAVRAVRGIETLHPLPADLAPGQPMEARVFFANSPESYEMMTKALDRRLELASRSGSTSLAMATLAPLVISAH